MGNTLDKNLLSELFLNTSVEIDIFSFVISIILSLVLALVVKYTYIKTSQSLSNREYFSDIFIPLSMITCLVITVIKFSLALSLGLVGALSIVRFRAAIKEPEELVYLFFVIGIGLANGANQYILATFATLIICLFLFIKLWFNQNQIKNNKQNPDVNLVQINIKNRDTDIAEIINLMKVNSNYLKLKSAQVDKDLEDYTFFIEFKDSKNMNNFIKTAKRISKKNVHISLFNRLGVYE
tara:strand:- start:1508 stop:2221 length:714 start_codon:yes stop_codon:yes gene_type:complete